MTSQPSIIPDNIKTDNLVWLDMEMTGLDHNTSVILEVAVVVTDKNLNILAQSPSWAIFQPEAELAVMDKWNTSTHTKSGLVERVRQSQNTVTMVEEQILQLLKPWVEKGKSPLCGNTIHQDRKFISKYMPHLDAYLHYRNVDVSTIKELARRWYPSVYGGFEKHNRHEALADIIESINELKYYRDKIFQ